MNDRVLPKTELFASCPYDGPILEYYNGQFESVFVILHPFLKPTSINKKRFYPETYPKKSEIISGCESVSWKQVIDLTNLTDISEVDIALRTGISGLKEEFANESFAHEIDMLDEKHDIVRPCEGDLPEIINNQVFEAIKNLAHNWLWVGDELGTERKLYWIEDLLEDDLKKCHCNYFTHDHSLLVTTHWDSHFSFLCSSKEIITTILRNKEFEGFFCDAGTEVYWSLNKI